jgi:hypothetical protein
MSLFRATLTVARKELVASFRDRQTTMAAIVMPIVMYPAMFWCAVQGMLLLEGRRETTSVQLGLATAEPDALPPGITVALEVDPELEARKAFGPEFEDRNQVRLLPLGAPLDEEGARAWLEGGDRDPRANAGEEDEPRPDAVLFLGPRDQNAQLFFDSTTSKSEVARRRIKDRLPRFAETLRQTAAEERGLTALDLEPFTQDPVTNLAQSGDVVTYALSFILPILMVVMTLMGAFFPAVDLTAGERERNTAETTLLLPVPRLAVHQGKILAVCATAILSTTLNLFALGISAGHLLSLASSETFTTEIPVLAFLAVTPLAVLFAFFASAFLTSVASRARTFKEGQAMLGPAQMIFFLPAMAGAIPGVEFTPGIALIPIVNVVFAFRSMLRGQVLPLEYTLTALSLLVMAALSVWVAVRLLSREDALAQTAPKISFFRRFRRENTR